MSLKINSPPRHDGLHRHASVLGNGSGGDLLTGDMPVAVEDTELGQQHAHWSIAKLVEQFDTDRHIL